MHPRTHFLRLYLDSAPYFKTKYDVFWAAEMLASGPLQRVMLSYMVAGCTKFKPDVMFSQTALRFFKPDVFETSELLRATGACSVVPHGLSDSEVQR